MPKFIFLPRARMLSKAIIGRSNQPPLPPHRQTSRLPSQPQRKRLHPTEKQTPPQNRRMGQRTRRRRPHHPALRLLRRTPNPLRRRQGSRRGMQEARHQVRAAQDHHHDASDAQSRLLLHDGDR